MFQNSNRNFCWTELYKGRSNQLTPVLSTYQQFEFQVIVFVFVVWVIYIQTCVFNFYKYVPIYDATLTLLYYGFSLGVMKIILYVHLFSPYPLGNLETFFQVFNEPLFGMNKDLILYGIVQVGFPGENMWHQWIYWAVLLNSDSIESIIELTGISASLARGQSYWSIHSLEFYSEKERLLALYWVT